MENIQHGAWLVVNAQGTAAIIPATTATGLADAPSKGSNPESWGLLRDPECICPLLSNPPGSISICLISPPKNNR